MNITIKILLLGLIISASALSQSTFQADYPEAKKGDKLFEDEKYRQALAVYDKLPATEEVLKRRGATYIKLWDMPSAISNLRKALKRDPDDTETMAYLAEALRWDKKFDEAAVYYKKVLAREQASAMVRLGYAKTLAWKKDLSGALEQYTRATKEFPENLDAYMGLAEVLSWNKEFDRAIEAYRRVVSLTHVPAYKSVALANIGKMLTWKGDTDAAKRPTSKH